MNFRKPKLQFGMRKLLFYWVLTAIFAGIFARALFAEFVAQQQAVAVELQSKQDWLIVLERDRDKAIERYGPLDNKVAKLTLMIRATQSRISRLESQVATE